MSTIEGSIKTIAALAKLTKICAPFFWGALLVFIFLRPFISEYAFLTVGFWYVFALSVFLCLGLAVRGGVHPFKPAFNCAVTVFFALIVLSVVFSGSVYWSVSELYLFIPNILIFYLVSKLDARERSQLVTTVFLSALAVCFYALYQYFIGLEHVREYIARAGGNAYAGAARFLQTKRAFGTFISPNIFVSYVLMMFFLSAGLTLSLSRQRTMLYWLSVFIMGVALVLTKSVGGILVFIAVLPVFVLRWFSSLQSAKAPRVVLRLGGAVFLVLFLAGTAVFVRQRLPQFFAPGENNSVSQRYYYWQASVRMADDAWATGVGWRKFGALYQAYKSPLANDSHYAHNVFLQMWAETGLLGLAGFCWIVILFFKSGAALLKRKVPERMFFAGLYCAGLAFLLHNLIDLSFYFSQAAFFWWVVLGLINNFSTEQNPSG